MATYADIVSVIFLLLYKIIELDNSVTIETQLSIAPLMMPLLIIGTVILTNVLSFDVPRLIEASSILSGICISVALADLIEYGILLITNEAIMIAIVPVSTMGGLLKATTIAIPITEPGMM